MQTGVARSSETWAFRSVSFVFGRLLKLGFINPRVRERKISRGSWTAPRAASTKGAWTLGGATNACKLPARRKYLLLRPCCLFLCVFGVSERVGGCCKHFKSMRKSAFREPSPLMSPMIPVSGGHNVWFCLCWLLKVRPSGSFFRVQAATGWVTISGYPLCLACF